MNKLVPLLALVLLTQATGCQKKDPNPASGLYLDFGDGRGYQPAAWNVALGTSYPTAGTKLF